MIQKRRALIRVCVLMMFAAAAAAASGTVRAVPLEDGRTAPVVDRAAIAAAGAGETVLLNLPDGAVTGEVTWRRDHENGRFVIAGRLQDTIGSFVLASMGPALYGHVRRPGEPVTVVRTVGGSGTVVERLDMPEPFCEMGGRRPDPGTVSEAAGIDDCDDGTVIDVLAVYTPDAAADAGGIAEMEAAIDLAIAENNLAWADSGLAKEQNLVLAWQLDPIGTHSVSLDCLIDPADGCLDEIHPLRDAFGADLVAFIEDRGGSVTYGLESLDPAHEALAFALTPLSNFSNVVMSHELGHQMGCCHALGDGGGCDDGGLYPYSNGHRFVGDSETEWRTVMAYSPGTHALHYSNPWVSHDGQPTGVPQTAPDSADNVATIEGSAHLVSNYRCPGACAGTHLRGSSPDCNDNDMPDFCDITVGTSSDYDHDRVPDDCEDPCDGGPVLVVSSDAADAPDFATIQQAVDAAVQPGTCIEILPGITGVYSEAVVVDRGLALRFLGRDRDGDPPVVDGAAAPAFDVLTTADSVPVHVENLRLRGQTGIRSAVSTRLERLVFEGDPTMPVALDVNGGTCTAIGLQMDETVVDGIDLADGAVLNLQRSSLTGLQGTAGMLAGRATLTNVLIGGADTGLVVAETGSLSLDYTTVASSRTGAGIDNPSQRYVTGRLSILYGNAGQDMIGAECYRFLRSVVGSPGCQIYWSSRDDPLLDASYVPQTGSSAIDIGPDPATYTGAQCVDLTGAPRLRDHDGDGLAHTDAGPFEVLNDALTLDVVTGLRWAADGAMTWDATAGAVAYHLYRSDSSSLGYGDFGACIDDRDSDRSDERYDGSAEPPPGDVFFYRVTAEGPAGDEGSLGMATCIERSNFAPCS